MWNIYNRAIGYIIMRTNYLGVEEKKTWAD